MADAAMQVSRLVLLLFLCAQAFDGVFTYVAVSAVGIHAEGNVLLSTWMSLVGPGPTLVVAKLVAAAAGLFVYYRGLHGLLATLTALYGLVAIGPWLVVYRSWP
jgi:uncharacterized membrane protein